MTAVDVEWPINCASHVLKLPAALCFNEVVRISVLCSLLFAIEIVSSVEGLSTAGIR